MELPTSPSVIFLQANPSQLDGPFYGCLARLTSDFGLLLLNGDRSARHEVDPELGFVPQFPDDPCDYPRAVLPREQDGGIDAAIRLIRQMHPAMLVIQDQSWRGKIRLLRFCRSAGIAAAVRSDKNAISQTARTGMGHLVESCIFNALVRQLAPVSHLTTEYYRWKRPDRVWSFPYPSSTEKFAPGVDSQDHRSRLRMQLNISAKATVFLVVAKFVDRENVQASVRAFADAARSGLDMNLVLVGAGALDADLKRLARDLEVWDKVRFTGYVPFVELQHYFWATDVFVHLAKSEPWGASAQDALVARMGLITTNKVGAGVCHLTGKLARFVVPLDDTAAAAANMLAVASGDVPIADFKDAWDAVDAGYTAEALACLWASRLPALNKHPART